MPCPGYTRTEALQAAIDRGDRDPKDLMSQAAMGRLVEPHEVAVAVALAVSVLRAGRYAVLVIIEDEADRDGTSHEGEVRGDAEHVAVDGAVHAVHALRRAYLDVDATAKSKQ